MELDKEFVDTFGFGGHHLTSMMECSISDMTAEYNKHCYLWM